MSIGTVTIELHVFKKKKEKEKKNMDRIRKTFLGSYNIIHNCCSFTEIFGILFSFHMFSTVKLLKV